MGRDVMPSEPSAGGFISPAVLRPAPVSHMRKSAVKAAKLALRRESLRRFAIWRRHEWRRRLGASLEEEAGLTSLDALENSQNIFSDYGKRVA